MIVIFLSICQFGLLVLCYYLQIMTYPLAWKTKESVFLAADTAITTISEEKLNLGIKESSFGQENFLDEEEGRMVEERVVKLFLRKNIGITFAGNYILALKVTTIFYKKINEGCEIREALNEALFLNPIPNNKSLEFIVGYYENKPKLLYFNSKIGSTIKEGEGIIQIGNPLEVHKKLTEEWVNDTSNSQAKPEVQLVAILGVLQSYNLFSPQMERGIGGAFCGLRISKDGGFWQPDILYMDYAVSQGKLVSTGFRHDSLVINSPNIGRSRCLASYTFDMTQDRVYEQTKKAVEKGRKFHMNSQFEYIIMVHVQNVALTIVEMQRKNKHEFIWIESIKDDQEQGTKITLFPEMRAIANRPKEKEGLIIIPYRKPKKGQKIPVKHISKDI